MLRRTTPLVTSGLSRFFSSAGKKNMVNHQLTRLHGPYVAQVHPNLANEALKHLPDSQRVGGLHQAFDPSGQYLSLFNALHRRDIGDPRVFFYTDYAPFRYEDSVHWDSRSLPQKGLPIVPVVITDGEKLITPHPQHIEAFLAWMREKISSAPVEAKRALEEIALNIKSIAESTNYNRPTPGKK